MSRDLPVPSSRPPGAVPRLVEIAGSSPARAGYLSGAVLGAGVLALAAMLGIPHAVGVAAGAAIAGVLAGILAGPVLFRARKHGLRTGTSMALLVSTTILGGALGLLMTGVAALMVLTGYLHLHYHANQGLLWAALLSGTVTGLIGGLGAGIGLAVGRESGRGPVPAALITGFAAGGLVLACALSSLLWGAAARLDLLLGLDPGWGGAGLLRMLVRELTAWPFAALAAMGGVTASLTLSLGEAAALARVRRLQLEAGGGDPEIQVLASSDGAVDDSALLSIDEDGDTGSSSSESTDR